MSNLFNKFISSVSNLRTDQWVEFVDELMPTELANRINDAVVSHNRIVNENFILINSYNKLVKAGALTRVYHIGFGNYNAPHMHFDNQQHLETQVTFTYVNLSRVINTEFRLNCLYTVVFEIGNTVFQAFYGPELNIIIPILLGIGASGGNRRHVLSILVYSGLRVTQPLPISVAAGTLYFCYGQMLTYSNTIRVAQENITYNRTEFPLDVVPRGTRIHRPQIVDAPPPHPLDYVGDTPDRHDPDIFHEPEIHYWQRWITPQDYAHMHTRLLHYVYQTSVDFYYRTRKFVFIDIRNRAHRLFHRESQDPVDIQTPIVEPIIEEAVPMQSDSFIYNPDDVTTPTVIDDGKISKYFEPTLPTIDEESIPIIKNDGSIIFLQPSILFSPLVESIPEFEVIPYKKGTAQLLNGQVFLGDTHIGDSNQCCLEFSVLCDNSIQMSYCRLTSDYKWSTEVDHFDIMDLHLFCKFHNKSRIVALGDNEELRTRLFNRYYYNPFNFRRRKRKLRNITFKDPIVDSITLFERDYFKHNRHITFQDDQDLPPLITSSNLSFTMKSSVKVDKKPYTKRIMSKREKSDKPMDFSIDAQFIKSDTFRNSFHYAPCFQGESYEPKDLHNVYLGMVSNSNMRDVWIDSIIALHRMDGWAVLHNDLRDENSVGDLVKYFLAIYFIKGSLRDKYVENRDEWVTYLPDDIKNAMIVKHKNYVNYKLQRTGFKEILTHMGLIRTISKYEEGDKLTIENSISYTVKLMIEKHDVLNRKSFLKIYKQVYTKRLGGSDIDFLKYVHKNSVDTPILEDVPYPYYLASSEKDKNKYSTVQRKFIDYGRKIETPRVMSFDANLFIYVCQSVKNKDTGKFEIPLLHYTPPKDLFGLPTLRFVKLSRDECGRVVVDEIKQEIDISAVKAGWVETEDEKEWQKRAALKRDAKAKRIAMSTVTNADLKFTAWSDLKIPQIASLSIVQYEFFLMQYQRMNSPIGICRAIFNISCWLFSYTNINVCSIPRHLAESIYGGLVNLITKVSPTFTKFFSEAIKSLFNRDSLSPADVINAPDLAFSMTANEFLQMLKRSEFASALQNFLLTASTCTGLIMLIPGMTKQQATKMFMICGAVIGLPNLLEAAGSLVDIIMNQVAPAIIHRDPSFMETDKYKEKIACITLVLDADKNHTDPGRYREVLNKWFQSNDYSEADDFQILSNTRVMIKEMREFLEEYQTIDCKKLNFSLITVDEHVCNALKFSKRSMPLGIAISGDPNIGKTTLTTIITSEIADILKIRPQRDENGRCFPPKPYTIALNANFQENAHPSDQVILFDDVGQTINKAANMGVTFQTIFDIMSVVKTPIPLAALERKIDNYWGNILTFITSNDPKFGTSGNLYSEEAFLRRFPLRIYGVKNPDTGFVDYTLFYMTYGYPNHKWEQIIINTGTTTERTDKICDIARKMAMQYMEHQSKDDNIISARIEMCEICRANKRHCAGHTIPVPIPQSGACFFGNYVETLAESDRKICLTFLTFLEEFFMSTLFFILPQYFVLWLMLRFLGDIFGRGKGWTVNIDVLWVLFTISLSYLAVYTWFPITVILHIYYNIIAMRLDANLTLKTRAFFLKFGISIYEVLSVPIETAIKEAVIKKFVPKWKDFPWKDYLLYAIGGVASIKLLSGIFTHFQKANLTYTGYMDLASQEDVDFSNNLQETMIKCSHMEEDNGLASSWKNKITNYQFKKRGQYINNTIFSSILRLDINNISGQFRGEHRVMGFYTNGAILTCKHMLNVINVHSEMKISYPNQGPDSPKFALNPYGGKFYQFKGDAVKIPFPRQTGKPIPIFEDYVCGVNDVLIYKDKEYVPMSIVQDKQLLPGSFAVDAVTQSGDSGLPIFIIRHKGVDIEPMIVGVQSMMDNKNLYPIFSPLVKFEHSKWEEIDLSSEIIPYIDDSNYRLTMFSDLTFPKNIDYEPLDNNIQPEDIIEEFAEAGYRINVDQLHPKSELRHLSNAVDLPNILEKMGWIGNVDTPVRRFESKFRESEMYEKVMKAYQEMCMNYVIPNLNPHVDNEGIYYSPSLAGLRQCANRSTIYNFTPYEQASDIVFDYLYENIKLDLIHTNPLDINQIIEGTKWTNPLNPKAGLGFPYFKGVKGDTFAKDESTGLYVFYKKYAEGLQKCYLMLDSGKHVSCICTWITKDEVVEFSKNYFAKNRQYSAGNFYFLLLCRQYISPFMDILMKRRDILFAQIGMNAMGKEFHNRLFDTYKSVEHDSDFDKFLQEKGWLDSDYSKYDKYLLVLPWAVEIVWRLALKSPFYADPHNAIHKNRLKLILESLKQYVTIVGRDVFLSSEGLCSGVYGTAPINCICEAILEVLQFYYCIWKYNYPQIEPPGNFIYLFKRNHDFFKVVSLRNYGDDNIKYVHKLWRKYYSHERIKAFAEWSGMPITPARKSDLRIEFKTVQEILFLKRTPVYEPSVDCLVGRLEKQSIMKSLLYTDSDDPRWKKSVLDQARREMSLHTDHDYYYFCENFFPDEYIKREDLMAYVINTSSYIWFESREDDQPKIVIENDLSFSQ